MITDQGRKFRNKEIKDFCSDKNIIHHITGLESHGGNGRVERLIKTIREELIKFDKETIEGKLKEII